VRVRRLLLAAIVLLLAGCAASDAPAPAAGARERRYQATATVLQSRDHGPELCLTGMAGWLPACRGLPIPNWRWDQVEGEQAAGSTIWGRYRLVGTYDGASFTVSRADLAPPERQPSHQEQFKDEPKPGCPEPAGGWQVPDPARRSEGYLEPVTRAARAEPDFAGVWLSYLAPMGNKVAEDPGEFVLNVAFTGDLARHRPSCGRGGVGGCASPASSGATASCCGSNVSCRAMWAPTWACGCWARASASRPTP
jgi:hypothetical protein